MSTRNTRPQGCWDPVDHGQGAIWPLNEAVRGHMRRGRPSKLAFQRSSSSSMELEADNGQKGKVCWERPRGDQRTFRVWVWDRLLAPEDGEMGM